MRADVDPGAWGTLYRLGVNTRAAESRSASIATGVSVTAST
jgi:hypothetical protein